MKKKNTAFKNPEKRREFIVRDSEGSINMLSDDVFRVVYDIQDSISNIVITALSNDNLEYSLEELEVTRNNVEEDINAIKSFCDQMLDFTDKIIDALKEGSS